MRSIIVILLVICGIATYFWLASPEAAVEQAAVSPLPTVVPPVSADTSQAGKKTASSTSEIEKPEVSPTGPHPKFVADERELNFGRMELQEEREHRFEIRNEGEAVLRLTSGNSTCQCTLFELDSKVVQPGESTWLHVRWRPKDRNDAFRHGGDVYTNDPDNQTVQFAVEGAVDAPIEVQPEQLWNVGAVYADRPGKMSAVIGSRVYDDFEIRSITTNSEFVTTSITPLTADLLERERYLAGYAVAIEVSSEIPSGVFSTEVKMDVTRAKAPLVATLQAVKRGTIQLMPAPGTFYVPDKMLVRFGQFQASKGRSVKLQMIVNLKGMDEPFRITEVNSDPSFIEARIEPIAEPINNVGRYWLFLDIAPGKPRVTYGIGNRGVLELSTNHPQDSTIVLGVELSSS